MKYRFFSTIGIVATVFFVYSILASSKSEEDVLVSNFDTKTQNKLASESSFPAIHSIDIQSKNFDFCGEKFPVENFDVFERLDREILRNAFYHSSTIQAIKLANRYFPVIEPILAEHGIPEDFKYLAVTESGLRNVTSPARAKGVWQFMKGTGKEYGLDIATEIDERYHLKKATHAACDFLNSLHDKFGSWTLTATAYNRGRSGLLKEIDQQKSNSFFDLNINQETMQYVFRIVAFKEIMSNPEEYGFFIQPEHKYPPMGKVYLINVDKSVPSWANFAKENGVSYRTLKMYNPWLTASKLTNKKGKRYQILLPLKN